MYTVHYTCISALALRASRVECIEWVRLRRGTAMPPASGAAPRSPPLPCCSACWALLLGSCDLNLGSPSMSGGTWPELCWKGVLRRAGIVGEADSLSGPYRSEPASVSCKQGQQGKHHTFNHI